MKLVKLDDCGSGIAETFELLSGYYSPRSSMSISEMSEKLGFECVRVDQMDSERLCEESENFDIGFVGEHDDVIMFKNSNNLKTVEFAKFLMKTWGEMTPDEIDHHVQVLKDYLE